LCGAGEAVRHLPGVLDAAARYNPGAHPADVAGRAPRARAREEVGEPRPLRRAPLAQQVKQHERPLALADVAAELLAVASLVAHQVQQVVLDLERRPEE